MRGRASLTVVASVMLPVLFQRWLVCAVLGVSSLASGQDVPPEALPSGEPPAQTDAAEPAADDAQQPDPLLASPRSTILAFVEAMQSYAEARDPDDLDRALRTLAVADATTAAGVEEASQLYAVLLRLGDLASIPENALPESMAKEDREFLLYPATSAYLRLNLDGHTAFQRVAPDGRIALNRDDLGQWRFSDRTLDEVGQLLTAVEGIEIRSGGEEVLTPAQWIRRHIVPASLKEGRLLRIEYWQWIAIGCVLLVGFTVDWLIRALLSVTGRLTLRTKGSWPNDRILKNTVRPFGLFASALVFYFGVDLIGLPAAFVLVARIAVTVFLVLAGVQAALRIVDLVADWFERRAAESESKLDDVLVPLFRKVAKAIIFIMAAISIAEYLELPYIPLLSGLGIGGLAFAFAAKDTVENFFGSIAVIADRPFEVGDWVVIDDTEGTVESLGLRSTRIRTFYNSQITVPNAELVRARVDNYGRRNIRRYKTLLNLAYNTPPARIEAFCEGIRELIRQHPYTHKESYHVWLNQFGAHSLDVLVYMFFQTPDWATELRERHRLMLDILRLADRLEVEFAYPTQTLHLRRAGQDVAAASPVDAHPDTEAEARQAGRSLAAQMVADVSVHERTAEPVRFEAPPPPMLAPADTPSPPPSRRRLFGRRKP